MDSRSFFAAALGFGLGWMASCAPPAPTGAAASAPIVEAEREVRVAPAVEQVWERLLHVTGELVAAEESTLSTKVAGRIESLTVDIGTRVRQGEVLASIEARDYELRLALAQSSLQAARALLGLDPEGEASDLDPEQTAVVREARAELDQAKRELERQTNLESQGASTKSALDVATTALQSAESRYQTALETVHNRRALLAVRQAELELAQQELDDTQVRAPYDGVVLERLAGSGDYVSAGDPLARLLRSDPVRLRLHVAEQHSGGLQLEQELRVRFDSGAPERVARIARFAPALGARDRTLLAEADLPNPDGSLRPGSFARADIVLDPQARTLVIPPAALVRFAGIDKVFVVEGDTAREQRVVVGRIDAERVEVLEGLTPGAALVLDPGKLQAGARVRVLPKD